MGFLSKVLLPSFLVCLAALCGIWASWQIIIHAPEITDLTVRLQVEASIVKIENLKINAYGTGFAVSGKNGKTYILTNRHVCYGGDKFTLSVFDLFYYESKIVKMSKKYDLCLLQAPAKIPPLPLAKTFYWGQTIFAVGHPEGYKIHISQGKLIDHVAADASYVIGFFTKKDCKKSGGWIKREVSVFLVPSIIETCQLDAGYLVTSTVIASGSSGSPLVTISGEVVGVVAMKDKNHWGLSVPFTDVEDFLKEVTNE